MKKVVALGGGHGLSNVLRGLRRLDELNITAIVSVADDGGSSGRLRRELDVVAPGDVRNCLLALSDTTDDMAKEISSIFKYRFHEGELDGHSLGNLMLVALTRTTGSFEKAVVTMSGLLKVKGKVLPATESSVVLCADTENGVVRGQVEIEKVSGIERITLDPSDAVPMPEVVEAINDADHIIYSPGSLFTSLIPVVVINDISKALLESNAYHTMILNLSNRGPNTNGMSGNDYVQKVIEHGGKVDQLIVGEGSLNVEDTAEFKISYRPLSENNETHDIELLAGALKDIIF